MDKVSNEDVLLKVNESRNMLNICLTWYYNRNRGR